MGTTTVATLLVKIGVKVTELNKGLSEAEKKVSGFKGTLEKHGKKAALVFGGMSAAITAGLSKSISSASEFQSELVSLGNLANVTGKELNALGRDAMKMGADMGISSKEVVHGLGEMKKIGYETAEAMKILPHIMKLAKVRGVEFSSVLQLTESAMSVFKLSASDTQRVTDAFNKTMKTGLVKLDDLKQGFKYAAPAAKAAGLTVEDLSAAIGILATNGTKGSSAGTTLRMALGRLASDNKNVKTSLDQLGISITNEYGKMKPFSQIVEELGGALGKMSDKQRLSTANMLFGTEAASGMLKILSQGQGKFTAYAKSIEDSSGSVNKDFQNVMKTHKEVMNRLKVNTENAGISIGNALIPALDGVANAVNKIAEAFNRLSPETQGFISKTLAAVASFLAFMTGVSLASKAISGLASALQVLGGFFKVLWSGVMFVAQAFRVLTVAMLANPIALIIAGVVALVALFIYFWNTSEGFRNFFIGMWEGIKTFFAGIPPFFQSVWDSITSALSAVGTFFEDIWNGITEGVRSALEWLYDHNIYVKALVDKIVELFTDLKTSISSIWESIKTFFSKTWNWIKSTASTIWNAVITAISVPLNTIWNAVKSAWEKIKSATSTAFNAVKNTVSNIWKNISDTLGGLAKKAFNWGSNMITMFVDGVKKKAAAVGKAIAGVAKSISYSLGFRSPPEGGVLSDSNKWMPNMMDMFVKGIDAGIPKLESSIMNASASIALVGAGGNITDTRNTTVNVYPQNANMTARDLAREMDRQRWLNGGVF